MITKMGANRNGEHCIIVMGRDRFGNEWMAEFDARRNEYGRWIFPLHQV